MENVITAPFGRARTATLIVVGPGARLGDEVAATLGAEDDTGALHIVRIITDGADDRAGDFPSEGTTISGLRAEYVNNAIAAVRLSSLPTIVWWRGGPPEGLDGVASLVDRVVLDAEDPWPLWARTPPLFEHTALTDIRWAKLTRWRAALAHFLDLPAVRDAASSLTDLSVSAADPAEAALLAGWLDASFGWHGRIAPRFAIGGSAPLSSLKLRGSALRITLTLLPNSTCVATEGRIGQDVVGERVVSLGNQSFSAFLSEELRIRSRDLAFEQALESALRGGKPA